VIDVSMLCFMFLPSGCAHQRVPTVNGSAGFRVCRLRRRGSPKNMLHRAAAGKAPHNGGRRWPRR